MQESPTTTDKREYPYSADIEVSLLRLDTQNPRVRESPDTQIQAIQRMAEVQGSKLVALARDIVNRGGLNPAQYFIVIPDDDDQFIVMDGNRRICALKALEEPDNVVEALGETRTKQLKELKKRYTPVEYASCIVFEAREEARPWMELLHEGEQDGAGTVPWTAQQKNRYYARKGTKSYHLQVLDYVMSEGTPDDKTKRRYDRGTYPISTLLRTLSTPDVREGLGIDFVKNQVVTKLPKKQIIGPLTRVVNDIGSGVIKVGDVMNKNDRIDYIDSFSDSGLPDLSLGGDVAVPIEEATDDSKAKPRKQRRSSGTRPKLIPADYRIDIDVNRINVIYFELRRQLKIAEVPNAAGVLLRVFLELGVDVYMERNGVSVKKNDHDTLENKVKAVANDMRKKGVVGPKELNKILQTVGKDKIIVTLHDIVHDKDMSVGPADLRALWDRLAPFIEKLWA